VLKELKQRLYLTASDVLKKGSERKEVCMTANPLPVNIKYLKASLSLSRQFVLMPSITTSVCHLESSHHIERTKRTVGKRERERERERERANSKSVNTAADISRSLGRMRRVSE
jgi:hypothetical protein